MTLVERRIDLVSRRASALMECGYGPAVYISHQRAEKAKTAVQANDWRMVFLMIKTEGRLALDDIQ